MKIWKNKAGEKRLKRYPFAGAQSHQAWDAADEWIVSRLPVHSETVMITGEAFGALGTAWGSGDITAAGDSVMSFEALKENRKLNPDSSGKLSIIKTTDAPPEVDSRTAFSKIFIRLPKSLELLDIYLKMVIPYADAETEIWLGGMEKRWSRGTVKATEKYLSVTEVFPFERHARWIQYKKSANADTTLTTELAKTIECDAWDLERYPLSICPSPSVFSNSSTDPGTSAFIQAFPGLAAKEADSIVDLGCGSGILGLCAASINPEALITFTDESYLATASAEKNFTYNKLSSQTNFLVTNGATGVEDSSQDLVLCNPPFHYQNIQSREPAEFLFGEALRVLKPGGTVQVVGNSHLGYQKLLVKFFPDAKDVYQNSKFTVLRGRKAN